MVDRYRPKNYRQVSPGHSDDSKDSELFKGENPIEYEQVEDDTGGQQNEDGSSVKSKDKIPFKNLVVKQKREKILKFLMR